MRTDTFIETIGQGGEKPILFHIDRHQVPESYHISEIKKMQVESVDCGGRSHSWKENVFHLFIPSAPEQLRETMTNNRLNEIFHRIGTLDTQAELTVEYSRATGEPLANYVIDRAHVTEGRIDIFLAAKKGECKPLGDNTCKPATSTRKGGCCG